MARGHLLLPFVAKVSKNTLCAIGPKEETNHRHGFYVSLIKRLSQSFCKLTVHRLSVIVSFLRSASRVLFSAHLFLRVVLLNFAARFCFHQAKLIVCHASLSYLFTLSQPDSRWSLVCAFLQLRWGWSDITDDDFSLVLFLASLLEDRFPHSVGEFPLLEGVSRCRL